MKLHWGTGAPDDLKPCPHMRTLVSAWIDGKLGGLARWYTERHVAHCTQCQASVPFLRGLQERLLRLGGRNKPVELTPERWAAVEEAWEKIDRD